MAAVLQGRRLAGPGAGRRQRPRRPGRGPPRRARLVRQERQPAAARARAAGSCSARWSPTPRCAAVGEPGRRRLRPVHAAASTAAPPAPSSRPAWSTPAAACRGSSRPRARSPPSSAWRSATASTAATTARRCARRTAGPRVGAAVGRRASRGRPARPARPRRRRRARPHGDAGTSPSARSRYVRRNALVALGNVGDGRDPHVVAALAAHLAPRRPLLRGHAAWAARRLGRDDLLAALAATRTTRSCCEELAARRPMTHLLVTNDFPPKVGGIQTNLWELWRRLDPDDVHRAHHAAPRQRARGTPSSRSASCAPRSRCCCPRRRWSRRIDALADEVGADLVVLDPALPVGLLGPRLRPALRRRAPRRRGHRARAGSPARPACCDACCAAPSLVVAAGGYPLAEGERAAGRALPERGRAAGRRHRAVPPARRRRAAPRPAPASACPWTAGWSCSLSRLVPRKGMDTLIRGRRPARPRPAPTSPSPSAAAAATSPRLERLVASTGAPGPAPRSGVRRRPARALRLRRRVRHALPQPVGRTRAGGLRHRVPRGGRRGRPAGRRRQRGRGRGGGPRRDRPGRARARRRRRRGRRPRPSSSTTPAPRARMGEAGRARAVADFAYDVLAARLGAALAAWEAAPRG